jgi:DNA primase
MVIDLDNLINYQDYYSKYVEQAKLNGDQLTGLCPLHPEKNPSFSANIKTGQWICRSGCGTVHGQQEVHHNATPRGNTPPL